MQNIEARGEYYEGPFSAYKQFLSIFQVQGAAQHILLLSALSSSVKKLPWSSSLNTLIISAPSSMQDMDHTWTK